MPTYCQNKRKANVTLNFPSNQLQITSKNPPVEITTTPAEELIAYSGLIGVPCYQHPSWMIPESPAVWGWTSYFANPQPSVNEIANFSTSFQASKNQELILLCACDNEAQISFNNRSAGNVTSFSSATIIRLIAQEGNNTLSFRCINKADGSSNPYGNPGGLYFRLLQIKCRIKVSDSKGIIYNKVFPACPTWLVLCDDECPKGYIKCETSNYPGYCCIPCSEIKSEIAAMRSMIRRLNNG